MSSNIPPGTGPPSFSTFAGVAAVHMGEAGAHIMQHSPGQTAQQTVIVYFILLKFHSLLS